MATEAYSTSRRLFLKSGPAAAVFSALSAAALASPAQGLSLKSEASAYGDLVSACRKAIDAHHEYDVAAVADEDHPDLDTYHAAEVAGVELAIRTPARTVAELKAKAGLLRMQLPLNRTNDGLWDGADLESQLAWALTGDILAMGGEG